MKTYLEATVVDKQIEKPCEDCPFRRKATAGWLADKSPAEYCSMAHSSDIIDCHTKKTESGEHVQCAGAAIYRANVLKRPDEPNITLPKDTKTVFATPIEFLEHHSRKKLKPAEIQKMMADALRKRMEEYADSHDEPDGDVDGDDD